jgi:hypothetical protein
MGRWYLGQLENGSMPEDVAFLDLIGAKCRIVTFSESSGIEKVSVGRLQAMA